MLTTLAAVKARLAIPDIDPQSDALLTSAIAAVSARFDREVHRTLMCAPPQIKIKIQNNP